MDDTQREALRAELLERRAKLQQLLVGSAESIERVEIDNSCQSQLSRVEAQQGREMDRATRARWEHELARIEGALGRMDNGEYGDCFICGEPIPLRRLQNDPSVTRCVECAEGE